MYAAGVLLIPVVWFDKSNKSWQMGSGPGFPFGLEDKAPLNLLDV